MTQRLANDPATERATALQQIDRIAEFRIAAQLAQ
jgi:2-oxo-4-hydroxy-4-carboxy--5-ureidoimidazoline (OHCU) decarboxylase